MGQWHPVTVTFEDGILPDDWLARAAAGESWSPNHRGTAQTIKTDHRVKGRSLEGQITLTGYDRIKNAALTEATSADDQQPILEALFRLAAALVGRENYLRKHPPPTPDLSHFGQ